MFRVATVASFLLLGCSASNFRGTKQPNKYWQLKFRAMAPRRIAADSSDVKICNTTELANRLADMSETTTSDCTALNTIFSDDFTSLSSDDATEEIGEFCKSKCGADFNEVVTDWHTWCASDDATFESGGIEEAEDSGVGSGGEKPKSGSGKGKGKVGRRLPKAGTTTSTSDEDDETMDAGDDETMDAGDMDGDELTGGDTDMSAGEELQVSLALFGCSASAADDYCAVDYTTAVSTGDVCPFMKSCCFSSYATITQMDVSTAEKACPGARAASTKACKA